MLCSNVVAVGGFDESLSCSQERDLHIRLGMCDLRLGQLREYLFTVRRRPGSVSSDSMKIFRGHYDLAVRYREMLKRQNKINEERTIALAAFAARAGRMLARNGLFTEAKRLFQLAKSIHPSGGLHLVYGPRGRRLVFLLGPIATEQFVRIVFRGPKDRV